MGVYINKKYNNESPLLFAIKKNRIEIAKCLIDHGVEISKNDLKENCSELVSENVDIMEYINETLNLKENKRKRNSQDIKSLETSDTKKIKHYIIHRKMKKKRNSIIIDF